MPKWIERWVERWEYKFPECAIRCSFNNDHWGYIVEAYYPKYQAWSAIGDWHIWSILLNPSPSSSVRQNRLWFRDLVDYNLRCEVDRLKGLEIKELKDG